MPDRSPQGAVDVARIVRLRADSGPGSLTVVRRRVRRVLAETPLPPEAIEDLELAVGELLSNVCRHAYPSSVGPVFVEVSRTERRVTVLVIDRGAARAIPAIPAEPPQDVRPGGRGLYLVSRVADEMVFAVNPIGHGLIARVSKWVPLRGQLRRSA